VRRGEAEGAWTGRGESGAYLYYTTLDLIVKHNNKWLGYSRIRGAQKRRNGENWGRSQI
jgi:hypothetical protein